MTFVKETKVKDDLDGLYVEPVSEKLKIIITIVGIFFVLVIGLSANYVTNKVDGANQDIFVSAQNSAFGNSFGGPMVVEVVISDPSISALNVALGEPDVTVNAKKVHMVQASDGNWYAYIASRSHAQLADSFGSDGFGTDFGTFCDNNSPGLRGNGNLPLSFSDTTGIAVSGDLTGGVQGTTAIEGNAAATCTSGAVNTFGTPNIHVVREPKIPNTLSPMGIGQINIDPDSWPFIQLYDFVPGPVNINYNKGGGSETVPLNFGQADLFKDLSLDRPQYPRNGQIHAIITDGQLNIDPTDEDSWTFGTSSPFEIHYQKFDENGKVDGDVVAGSPDMSSSLDALMMSNRLLKLNPNLQGGAPIIDLKANNNQLSWPTGGFYYGPNLGSITNTMVLGTQPITFVETGPGTGTFSSTDNQNTSDIVLTATAPRGASSSLEYHNAIETLLTSFSFGSLSWNIQSNQWNAGEESNVTLRDSDENTNSRLAEDLNFNYQNVLSVPAIKVGDPTTLSNGITSANLAGVGFANFSAPAQQYSDRVMLMPSIPPTIDNGDSLTLTFGTMSDLFKAAPVNQMSNTGSAPFFKGFGFLNYDVRSLANPGGAPSITSVDVAIDGEILATNQPLKGLIQLNNGFNDGLPLGNNQGSDPLSVTFTIHTIASETFSPSTILPVAVDIFGFGLVGDGIDSNERINNSIYRLEPQETGDNTSVFVGTIKYIVLNQKNIFDVQTYKNLKTIGNSLTIIPSGSPKIQYQDLGADGVNTEISSSLNTSSHSGKVSFDKEFYALGETVSVTLEDSDLNMDDNLIDIYTTVSSSNDPSSDAIGQPGLGIDSSGNPFGDILEIKFDEARWVNSQNNPISSCSTLPLGPADGLSSTGFNLVETGASTGIFVGDFDLPNDFCNTNFKPAEVNQINGLDLKVVYHDFSDSYGAKRKIVDAARIGTSQNKFELKFKSDPFTPTPGNFEINEIIGNHLPDDIVYFLVQFNDRPDLSQKSAMQVDGIKILEYVTGNSYVASAKVSDLNKINNSGLLNWAGPIKSVYKVSKPLSIGLIPANVKQGNSVVVTVFLHGDANLNSSRKAIEDVGGQVLDVASIVPSMTVKIDENNITQLAGLDPVEFVDIAMPPLDIASNRSRDASNITALWSQDSSLRGDNIVIMVYDQGVADQENPALKNNILKEDPGAETVPHSTQVAGIIAASDSINPTGSFETNFAGMAPHAKLLSYAVGYTTYNWWEKSSDLQENVGDAIENEADVANLSMAHNVSDDPNLCPDLGKYSEASAMIDQIVTGHIVRPLIFFGAVGNQRNLTTCSLNYSTITAPSTAKNIISVGAVHADDMEVANVSGFGPTTDGRIKPDVTAPGCHNESDPTTTTSSTGFGRTTGCATSFATPVATGVGAIIIQEWKKLYSNERPHPDTLKAIIIHSATDRGPHGPDFQYGWGTIDATAAFDLVKNSPPSGKNNIIVGHIEKGKKDVITFVADNPKKAKATIVWDDPKPNMMPIPTLINDLDLKLTNSNDKVFRPYLLSFAYSGAIQSPYLTHGVDTVNNVEMVEAEDLEASLPVVWIAEVSAPRSDPGGQNYSLIVSGTVTDNREVNDDINPPNVSVKSDDIQLGGITNKKNISFKYETDIPMNQLQCKLDNNDIGQCPIEVKDLADGDHKIMVWATFSGLFIEQSPFFWRIDTLPPVISIDNVKQEEQKITFNISSEEIPVNFSCKLDNSDWKQCDLPQSYEDLLPGEHNFSVFGTDNAGNSSPASSRSWTTPNGSASLPHTKLDSDSQDGTNIKFTFTADIAVKRFECKTDNSSWSECKSPKSYNLSPGSHTFQVRALNAENNPGPAESYSWIVQNGCLIATAAYGSELSPQVQQLRETRDNIVLKTASGVAFMSSFNSVYYTFAPTVAGWEEDNPYFKEIVKITITPMLTTLSILNFLDIDSDLKMITYGIGIILLNIGIYFVTPIFVIIGFKKLKEKRMKTI